LSIPSLRIDGGMSQNPTFAQALADAAGRPVEVSRVVEATTLGAAYLAGVGTGLWRDFDDVAASWEPASVYEPQASPDREQWLRAVSRAAGWIPELSALDF
jgi:glycerol kinase